MKNHKSAEKIKKILEIEKKSRKNNGDIDVIMYVDQQQTYK